MYSDRRYSLSRYSVSRSDKTVEVSEDFSEALGALAGAAVPMDIRGSYTEACQGSVQGTAALLTEFSALAGLAAAVQMSADVLLRAALEERVQGGAYGQKNTPAELDSAEKLAASLWASKDLPTHGELADSLSTGLEGVKDIYGAMSVFEGLTALLEASSQTTDRAVFQLTIPPGGELRINSELFTVLLNGENALHTQSGDWVNVSRELLRLTVESAAGGGLEGQLIYTERFL